MVSCLLPHFELCYFKVSPNHVIQPLKHRDFASLVIMVVIVVSNDVATIVFWCCGKLDMKSHRKEVQVCRRDRFRVSNWRSLSWRESRRPGLSFEC